MFVVCQSTDGDPLNPIVFCDGCDLMVHASCHGNPLVKAIPEGDWFCELCIGSKKNREKKLFSCCLCTTKSGAMKPTKDGLQGGNSLERRKLIRNLIAFSVFFEIIAVVYAIMTTRNEDLDWKLRSFRILPMFLLPALASLAYSSIVSFSRMCDRRDQNTLEKLQAELLGKFNELKERTNYYSGFRNDDMEVSVPVPSPRPGPVPGGVRDVPINEINGKMESLARFAVDEHNKNENALLEFARVVKAKTQVVAGAMYYLTVEVTHEGGKKKLYEAKVWEKSWLEFKELQWFKPAITPSELD